MKYRTLLVSLAGLIAIFTVSCGSFLAAEPTATQMPTETPIPTETIVPSPTPLPQYSTLGGQADEIADTLGWTAIPCGPDQAAEDLDKGIFLFRTDNNQYFCDFEGHIAEPVEAVLPQYVLAFMEVKEVPSIMEDGTYFIRLKSNSINFSHPSMMNADDIVNQMTGGSVTSLELLRTYTPNYVGMLRIWPLTEDQYNQLNEIVVSSELP